MISHPVSCPQYNRDKEVKYSFPQASSNNAIRKKNVLFRMQGTTIDWVVTYNWQYIHVSLNPIINNHWAIMGDTIIS